MAETKRKRVLFLCGCSTNISNAIDLSALVEWAEKGRDIDVVEVHNLLCSPDGKEFYKKILAEHKPNDIIIAACSPKMHEKTFQELTEEVGLNLGHVQMANIREQCAWVTRGKADATEKSRALINAAIERLRFSEDLERKTMAIEPDILIIGGGIAGIEAALTAAQADRKVYIVEKDISLGGSIIKTDDVAPNMECAPCLLAPRLSAVRDNRNIKVLANAEITDVLGFYGNFTVKIHKKARYVESSCIGCEACFEPCPVSVPKEFHLGLGNRKAIYTLFPGAVPGEAVIDRDNCLHFKDGSCDACAAACPFGSINFDEKDEDIEVKVGAIVIATGYESFAPSSIDGLGYGKVPNVYTLAQFERLTSSNGPTGAQIIMKNGKKPQSVAVIHCAGSLRDDGIPYCSGTCCVGATKVGELVRKQIPDAKVVNIHNDLVYPSPAAHEFFVKQNHEGTQFVKCDDLTSISIEQKGGKIKIKGEGISPIDVDMVVLATGMKPAKSTKELAELLNIDLTKDGFFKADHELLHATGASVAGFYIAGCAAGPCDVAESVTRAQAAVGDALSKLIPGREIELEIMTSVIDDEKCAGCKLCIAVCPYKAIIYNTEKSISEITEAICRGCGTCVATCPSGAAMAKHFTDREIYAEIGGLLTA